MPITQTQAGGPAALRGFLYQLLHHIGLLAEAQISASPDSSKVGALWALVLEPRSGGDAQQLSETYIVEQYKVRPATWSLREIREDVLRGLRRAVPDILPVGAAYRFVTDGRPGRGVPAFLAFIDRVRRVDAPDQLDAIDLRPYDGEMLSDRALFLRMCECTRSSQEEERDDEAARVFHLLRRFEVDWEATVERLDAKIDELLLTYFPVHHDARQARRNLLGTLLERLSQGEARFERADVRRLFVEVNLDPELPARLGALAETLADVARRHLDMAGYVRTHDVREAIDWPSDRPVLVIAGESGNGKTWHLARLVTDLFDRRENVVWSPPLSSSAVQIAKVTEDIWSAGLQQQGSRSLAALELCYRESMGHQGRWLTVACDDVQDPQVARELVHRDWSTQGARMAMATTGAIAAELESRFPTAVHVVEAGDFSVPELNTYLDRNGRSWVDLPDDLKRLLRKPILAGLYTSLPYDSFAAAPRSEYEIFDGFWERMKSRTEVGDTGLLLALASRVLSKDSYPLERSDWPNVGADSAAVGRLIARGWLARGAADEISFAHDRLLNWAAALEIARRVEAGLLDPVSLAELLAKCLTDPTAFSRPLRYVLMDVMWNLARSGSKGFELDAVLQALEAQSEIARDLYESLLPTVGDFAVDLFLRRLERIGDERDHRVIYLRKGLEELARQQTVSMAPAVQQLLASSHRECKRIAMMLIKLRPDRGHLPALWEMRQWHSKRPSESPGDATLWCDAVRACAALEPEWLVGQISASNTESENLADLAYVLVGLESPEAAKVWERVRHVLIEKVPWDRSRCVLYCISRFCDRRLVDYCLARLSDETDFLDGAALAALSKIAPDVAIERLPTVSDSARLFSRGNWMPALLEQRPREARQRILELAKERGSLVNTLAMLFYSCPDEMGPELLAEFLAAFERELLDRDALPERNDDWLHRPLDVLSRLSNSENLRVMRQAGRSLERLLAEAACRRLGWAPGSHDYIREGARLALLKIAGDGVVTFILKELESGEYWDRHGGLKWAEIAGLAARRPLCDIAMRWQEGGDKQSHAYIEALHALQRLAAIGADRELTDAIWAVGVECLAQEIDGVRSQVPMEPALVEPALRVLRDPLTSPKELSRALAIAWLSRDPAILPLVRQWLPQLEPTSICAALAFHTLWSLNDTSDDALTFAVRLLAEEDSRWLGVNLLRRFGERGSGFLQENLESRPPAKWDYLDHLIIETLHEYPSTKPAAEKAAVVAVGRRGRWLETPSFDVAAQADAPMARDTILEAAFSADRTVVGRAVEASRAVSRFQPKLALEALEAELIATPKTADSACRAGAEIAGARAGSWLIDLSQRLPADRRSAIGRTLRMLDATAVSEGLEGLLTADDRLARELGLDLAAWTAVPPDDRLREMAFSDPEGRVRDAATKALRRRRQHANAATLLAELKVADDRIRWSLLQSLTASAHPELLRNRNCDLWLGHALDHLPPHFARFATDQLRNRSAEKED